jgi:hypothetical protein
MNPLVNASKWAATLMMRPARKEVSRAEAEQQISQAG